MRFFPDEKKCCAIVFHSFLEMRAFFYKKKTWDNNIIICWVDFFNKKRDGAIVPGTKRLRKRVCSWLFSRVIKITRIK